jgi:hypothetical protein
MKQAFALACLLLAAALPAAAQTAAEPAAPAAHTAAIVAAPLVPGSADALLEDILSTNLTAMLEAEQVSVSGRLSLPTGADHPQLPAESRISRLLAGVNAGSAQVVVAAFYLTEGEQLTIQFALYDPAVKVVLGGVLTRARKGLTVFSSVSAAVGDFAPAVKRYVEGGYQMEPPTGIVERITVSGPQEGSRIVLVDREFGRISGGRLVIPYTQFEVGTAVPVRVMRDGYHSYEGMHPLDKPQVEISLPALRRETRFDADLHWSFGFATGIGIGGRFHIMADSLFLGVEHYRSLEASSVSSSLVRHYDTSLRIGQYVVFPHTSVFRVSVAAGLGLILTDVEGQPGREYGDVYVLVGDPTAELTLGPVTLFVRPDLHYALGVGYNLLGREWIRTPYGIPPLTVGARLSW